MLSDSLLRVFPIPLHINILTCAHKRIYACTCACGHAPTHLCVCENECAAMSVRLCDTKLWIYVSGRARVKTVLFCTTIVTTKQTTATQTKADIYNAGHRLRCRSYVTLQCKYPQ